MNRPGARRTDNTNGMSGDPAPSAFRFEKMRTDATVTLSTGPSERGCFFVAGGSPLHEGPERVSDLLNSEDGFFPFEIHGAGGTRTVLYNRAHVVMVALTNDNAEASRDSGYDVATQRVVSALLSNGQRVVGTVRVYRPAGRDRLSDWAHQPETFRYVETRDMTILVNVAHIVEVSEVPDL
jgi:hypothetical protein